MAGKVTYWLAGGGRDESYVIDLEKTFDPSDPSETVLSQFLGEPAGYIDPLYAQLVYDQNRDFIVKVEVDGVEYGSYVLIDFSIENSLSLSDELELGTVIPNKLTIRFRMHSQFPPNAKIVPYIALKSDNLTWDEADMAWEDAEFPWEGGTTDWIPLGEFYVDNRTKDRDIWTYVCYDRLIFADMPYVSQLNYPTSMQAVWDEICEQIGFTYDASVVIDPSYTIPAGPAGFTCRQVMGFIASANAACAYMGKDGVLRFRKISAADEPVFEMTESDYIRAKQTNPVKTYSRVVIIYDDEGNFYEAGTGSEAETLYIENPFGTQQMAEDILAEINGFSYTPISMPAKGFPHLDQGDVISFETVESMSWEYADIAWEDADFRWDGRHMHKTIILHQVLDFRGGLAMQIEAPSISEQQSEFPVEGTLTEAVNRLNRNAVRYGKPYYGVTHSRDEGIVVQREDGKAKAVFNADELAFYKGANKSLYFDVQNDRYVFDGHLQAASGTFTGELQGGSITIGSGNNVFRADTQGIWAGHANWSDAPFYVNMSGQLWATNANISGTITGSTINGGTINGALVNGSVIMGGTIMTAGQGVYPRIELNSSNQLLFAEAGFNNRLTIVASSNGTPAITFNFPAGGSALISPTGPELAILTTSGRHIAIGASGNLMLYSTGAGKVVFDNWNAIYSSGNGKTLQQELNDIWTVIASLL